MAASQSVLEILIQAVDESASALSGAQNNLRQVGQEAISAGIQIGIAGAAITAVYVGVVDSAASVQESQDSLKQAVTDAMAGAADSTSSYATQVAFLQDKINGYKASIAEATATLDTHTGSVEKSAASHAKAAASIATDQLNIQKYQQQLDILTNSQELNGQSVDEITAKLESQADANVSLGFSVTDSTNSLMQSFTATKSVSEALQVNQAAMDLARAKNIDLATATNQVVLAMNGQGRALATYGIQIKDGLSGMAALQAVQGAVNGQVQAYAETLSGSLSVAMQSFNKLLSDMGNTQMPMLTELLQWIVKIIDGIDGWTQRHQKLTETILIFVGILGGLLTLLGSLLVILGTLAVIVALLGGPFTLLIGLVALLAAVIIANWQNLKEDMQAIWTAISDLLVIVWDSIKKTIQSALNWITAYLNASLQFYQTLWNLVWGGISSYFIGIWDGIKGALTSSISFITGVIQTFVSWATGVFAPVLAAVNAIGGAASAFGKAAGGAVSGALSVIGVHDAIITPGGQIIQSDPADFLIATKTPGALLGAGGGGINVYIQGGMYLDQGGATLIANTIAKQIGRQLKLRNYAS
jgi:hypothetical protein